MELDAIKGKSPTSMFVLTVMCRNTGTSRWRAGPAEQYAGLRSGVERASVAAEAAVSSSIHESDMTACRTDASCSCGVSALPTYGSPAPAPCESFRIGGASVSFLASDDAFPAGAISLSAFCLRCAPPTQDHHPATLSLPRRQQHAAPPPIRSADHLQHARCCPVARCPRRSL